MMSRFINEAAKWWRAEDERHFLWLPVAFAGGIAFYFTLAVEPALWLCALLVMLSLAGLLIVRRRWATFAPIAIAFLLLTGGLLWAKVDANWQRQVVLTEQLKPRPVEGIVEDIERTEHGVRLTLGRVKINDLAEEKTPARIRLSFRLKADTQVEWPHIGDPVTMMAGLLPPMGPALPHGFDFSRYFFFRGIGAVGYGLPPWHILPRQREEGIKQSFLDWRFGLTDSIVSKLGEHSGPIAAGLITGEARAIPKEDFKLFRASNLYHIIAISGEHMVVIGGAIFITLRLLLLLLPGHIGQHARGKSWAAAVTLLLVTLYLFVTGMPISAVRAYIMIALVLVAVIAGRRVQGMRSLAIAFWLMLLYEPANLLDPGFQLSFAASLAILALVEAAWFKTVGKSEGWAATILQTLKLVVLVTLVAEAATTPLVIALFNNFSPYGVLANVIATPLVSFYLMPTVALYFLLLPFGLQGGALFLMDFGIRGLLAIAHFVASLPHAQLFVPALPGWGVGLFTLGLLWLCLWRQHERRYGLVLILLGMASLFTVRTPDLLMGPELKQVALRTLEHDYVLGRGRSTSMVTELWANGLGYDELPQAEKGAPNWRCDALGCVARIRTRQVAFPMDRLAVAEDCARADMVITAIEDASCGEHEVPLINGKQLKARGVEAVWLRKGRPRIETSADWQGERPWSAYGGDDEDED